MSALSDNAGRVQAALRQQGILSDVRELAATTRTAAEAAAALGATVAQIAKSLVFLAEEQPILVIASGINRVSMSKLAAIVGSQVAQPSGKVVKEKIGFPIGGIPPLGHEPPLRTIFDQDLLQFEQVWAAAGTPHAVFSCAPQILAQAVQAMVADIRE